MPERLKILVDLIRGQNLTNQWELLEGLKKHGIETTQSSISRDLKKLGVVKRGGVYRMSQIGPGESRLIERLEADLAGDHLIVLKTGVGEAAHAGFLLDRSSIPGILGTIAGDDTIFVAVESREVQQSVVKQIFSLFEV